MVDALNLKSRLQAAKYFDYHGQFYHELKSLVNPRVPVEINVQEEFNPSYFYYDIVVHFQPPESSSTKTRFEISMSFDYSKNETLELPKELRIDGYHIGAQTQYVPYNSKITPAQNIATALQKAAPTIVKNEIEKIREKSKNAIKRGATPVYIEELNIVLDEKLKVLYWMKKLSAPTSLKESINNILLEEEKSLYLCRKVTNGQEIIDWAKSQGFKSTLPEDEFHVTIINTDEEIEWTDAPDGFDTYHNKGGDRKVEALGDKGAIVLHITSPELQQRVEEFKAIGAKSKFPTYKPHVTITYELGDVDLSEVEPFNGTIKFGPEEFTESGKAPEIEEVAITVSLWDDEEDDDYHEDYGERTDDWVRKSQGYWITGKGDILPCSYDHEWVGQQRHHNNVADDHFNDESGNGDVTAYAAGWVRVRIDDGNFFIEYHSSKVTPKAYRVLLKKIDEFDGSFTLEDYKGAHGTYTDKRLLKVAMSRLNNA